MRSAYAALMAVVALTGCDRRDRGIPQAATTSSAAPPSPPSPPDSLALSLPGGTSIWFTAARSDRDSTGRDCVERVMEIRRDTARIAIPLLYTAAAPEPVDDSTIAASLWLHCRPGDRYLVDLRSGRPRRVPR